MMWLRRAAIGALSVWAILCVWNVVHELRGPAGWRAARADRFNAAVGMPMPGAESVDAVQALIAESPQRAGSPWLVALPPDIPDFMLQYVRFQLTQVAYPSRVDVIRVTEPAPRGADYAGIITAPGQGLDDRWRVVATHNGYTAYAQAGP